MSTPVHRTSERPSVAALTSARERREERRAGGSSGSRTSAQQALLGLQATAGNQAATASVQRARGRTLERSPATDTRRTDSDPGARRTAASRERSGSAPGALADRAPRDPDSEIRPTTSTPERDATPENAAETRFPPTGRTRSGSAPGARPAPAGRTRRGSESGLQDMEADPRFGDHIEASRSAARAAADRAAEEAARAAMKRAAVEAARTAAERTAEAAARTTMKRAAVEAARTATERAVAQARAAEEARAAAERAAEEARIAEEARAAAERLAEENARVAAERAAEEARISAERADTDAHVAEEARADTEQVAAETVRVSEERAAAEVAVEEPETTPAPASETDTPQERKAETDATGKKSDRLKEVAENADALKRTGDLVDAPSKGTMAPTSAGLGQQATAGEASGAPDASALKHDAAASGVSGASMSALTELLALGASIADSLRNLKVSLRKTAGAGHHNARKKAKAKATDAGVSVLSTGANGGAIAKDAVKIQGVANTATAAEASGILSAVAGLAKSIRAMGKVGRASSKYRKLRKLGDAGVAHAELLDTLRDRANTSMQNAAAAYTAISRAAADGSRPEEERTAAIAEAVERYEAVAQLEVEAKLAYFTALRDVDTLVETQKFAKKKQRSKIGKEMTGGVVGEGLKGAAGIVTATAVAAGTLASNPAGWIIAAVGAGLVVTVAGYKGGRAAYKRFQEAHHPERFTPDGEESPPVAKPTWESLKHAMTVWKKVSRHKRQLAAHKIYNMAASPHTDPELRRSAMNLLIAIKANPAKHNIDPEEWEASLRDPAGKADWIKEITDQLASA
ncbi:hypothetical protein [Streptomyces lancefieldiae]|uniref:Uncharacterized protein n=1 Tax=Streptomyces lancefieldiae TaxID=3075520 RepID=A0ABU3AT36_9ACTN|nr:hypothetical protein [Streptomyces sp. DSM 40712]MDT0612995.1 hypothetical protein [Streptomyces sp. DSM 40712]